MHAPVSKNRWLVRIKDTPFPSRNRLIHEKKVHASYHALMDTRNDLTDLRAVTLVLKKLIENKEQYLQKVDEFTKTLEERRSAFLPDPYKPYPSPPNKIDICQTYIDKWKAEMEQAKRKPINPHLWNAPMVLWFLLCLSLHGYGLYMAETSYSDMVLNMDLIAVVANTTDEKEVEELCLNATDWVIVLSCFFIATSSLNVLSYYVVYPFILTSAKTRNGWSYKYYQLRHNDHKDGNQLVCLPLHALFLCPWLIYGFVLFFNPMALACPTELYYYGFVYSIFPGTVFVLFCFMAICLAVNAIFEDRGYGFLGAVMIFFGVSVLIAITVLYMWFFVHVMQVGEQNLALNTMILSNQTESTSTLALAQVCAEGAQYLIDSGLTTLIYSAILLFFGIMYVPLHACIADSRGHQTADAITSYCSNFLLFGRFIIETLFAILGGVLFFNSERYACGAELFGFGLGLTIVFIFSALSTCNACSRAQPSEKK